MERVIRLGLLYDFYGELLTPKQQAVIERYCLNDLSLAEIAEQEGSSRQAIHDLVQRSEDLLEHYESKLHLYEHYAALSKSIKEALILARRIGRSASGASADDCYRLVELLESLQDD